MPIKKSNDAPLPCSTDAQRDELTYYNDQNRTEPFQRASTSTTATMDDEERMDLALNSNFDSELFDCWDDDDEVKQGMLQEGVPNHVPRGVLPVGAGGNRAVDEEGQRDSGNPPRRNSGGGERGGGGSVGGTSARGSTASAADGDCWETPEAFDHFARLPSFSMDHDYEGRRTEPDDENAAAMISEEATRTAEESSLLSPPPMEPSMRRGRTGQREAGDAFSVRQPSAGVVSSYSSIASASTQRGSAMSLGDASRSPVPSKPLSLPATGPGSHDAATQLHPLGTQSSAKCPPHAAASTAGSLVGLPAAVPADLQNAAFYPFALSALAAGAAAAAASSSSSMNGQQYLLNAVNNSNNHAVAAAAVAAIIANPLNQQSLHTKAVGSAAPPGGAAGITTQQQPMPPSEAPGLHSGAMAAAAPTRVLSGVGTAATTSNTGAAGSLSVPFDAPIELRANFENSLRAHGMLDAGSVPFPFGIAVNGFHPQQGMMGASSASFDAATAAASAAAAGGMSLGRSALGGDGEKRLKNAKEQQRAQRIAELIDELRDKMQKSGWSVGVSKSKFNTLSSCADYVKHLVKVTKEKEEAVKKARSDLETTRRKLEEDKLQQDPSDPESTTSSLTVSSSSSSAVAGLAQGRKKRDGEFVVREGTKKPKLSTQDSSMSSSSGDDTSKNPSGIRVVDLDHATSTVSDFTDSDKGSCSHHQQSDWSRNRSRPRQPGHASVDGSAGTNAAVADGGSETHSASTIQKRKQPPSEQSNSPDFELDYREAFVKSNVPQLIATTAGRIIAYNDFFLAITGMSSSDVERATIFSFVKSSRLSNLFEIVAKSLRSADPAETASSDSSQSTSDDSSSKSWNYDAMTLPCIRFPATHARQLYVTVTLMTDVDPRKRCFHCVLTDSPCTNGDIGRITPELLEMLFTCRNTKKEK